MSGGVDYSQMQQLLNSLEKADADINEFYEDCCRELAARLLAKVIPRTPVGKKPQFLKNNSKVKVKVQQTKNVKLKDGTLQKRTVMQNRTFLSADGAALAQYWGGYQGGTLRRGWTAGKTVPARQYASSLPIHHVGASFLIEVINPVEYASYVEFGHRQEPGRYVPALNRQLVKGWVPGQFFLTLSEDEIRRSKQVVLEKKLKSYLRGVFGA